MLLVCLSIILFNLHFLLGYSIIEKERKTRCVVLRPYLFIETASLSELMVKILFFIRCRIYNKYTVRGHIRNLQNKQAFCLEREKAGK